LTHTVLYIIRRKW